MADGGDFDGCEYVWSHELATRRLINMIRQQQDYCTENECFTEGQAPNSEQSTAVFFIGVWFLIAMVLFFLRPRSANQVPTEKSRDSLGPNFDPPAPPPTT